jgi:hypothetical protein
MRPQVRVSAAAAASCSPGTASGRFQSGTAGAKFHDERDILPLAGLAGLLGPPVLVTVSRRTLRFDLTISTPD